jgi:hypothetical protein
MISNTELATVIMQALEDHAGSVCLTDDVDMRKVAAAVRAKLTVDQDTSDGFHTFAELYRYRMLFNALLFNEWASGMWVKYGVHKSWLHHDGERPFGGGWFIVMAELPTGQISNHYPAEHWDLFKIPEHERANSYDGHTPEQAADRMAVLIDMTRVED